MILIMLPALLKGLKKIMGLHSSIIKAVLDLHKQGYSIVKISRILNLHIEEVANVINGYT
jgi:hypothetical protein